MACYVPFCESSLPYKKGAKREPGISFHQFPSDIELKKKWIVAIGKKDPKTGAYWDPHSSAVVCSLHFSPKQFNENSKRCRHLKPGSIPFIFPDYHLPQRGALIDLSSIKIIPSPSNNDLESTSKQSTITKNQSSDVQQISLAEDNTYSNITDIMNTNSIKRTFSEINCSETNNDETVDNEISPSKMFSGNKFQTLTLIQPDHEKFIYNESSNINSCTENFDIFPAISASTSHELRALQDNSDIILEQSVIRKKLKYATKRNKFLASKLNLGKSENERLTNELLKLQKENEELAFANRSLKEDFEQFNIEELKKGISCSNAKALFLYDQIFHFTEGRYNWSESSLKFLKYIEVELPTFYTFLKEADFITLPSHDKYF